MRQCDCGAVGGRVDGLVLVQVPARRSRSAGRDAYECQLAEFQIDKCNRARMGPQFHVPNLSAVEDNYPNLDLR